MKLKALFLGNCQVHPVKTLLHKNQDFDKNFESTTHANWQILAGKENLPAEELKQCDLLIYQPLKDVSGCFSTQPDASNSILTLIKSSCRCFSFPFVVNTALWPIFRRPHMVSTWYGQHAIEELIDRGLIRNDILALYDCQQIDWRFNKRYEESIGILRNKEINGKTNVKIADFIDKNITSQRLFMIDHHPTAAVMVELANQILSMMALEKIREPINYNFMGWRDTTHNYGEMWPTSCYEKNHYKFTFCDSSDIGFNFYRQILSDFLTSRGK